MTALVVARLESKSLELAEGAARLGLTAHQRDVALMIAQGASNAEIAARLGVSINTARYHVKRLFRRLEASGRQQIAGMLRAASSAGQRTQ